MFGFRACIVRPLAALAVLAVRRVLSEVLPPCHRPNETGSLSDFPRPY